jgi:hypothetical protein
MRPVGLQSCSGGISGITDCGVVWCTNPDPFSGSGAMEDGWVCVLRLPWIEVGMYTGRKRGWRGCNDAETLLAGEFEEFRMEGGILKEFPTLCVDWWGCNDVETLLAGGFEEFRTDVGAVDLCPNTLIVGW